MQAEKENKVDAEKALRLLAELYAHQYGLKVESIEITKKTGNDAV